MAALTRPTKEGGATTYQGKVALGFKDILASEVDADLDTIYAAWNGRTDLLWTASATALSPTDATKRLAVPGDASFSSIILGSATAKGRLTTQIASGALATLSLNLNRDLANGNAQDDATKPSWGLTLRDDTDQFLVQRSPAGSTTQTSLLTLDNVGALAVSSGRTTKARLIPNPISDAMHVSINNYLNVGASAWVQDDTTKPSWVMTMSPGGVPDTLAIFRAPAAGSLVQLITIDNAGNFTNVGSLSVGGTAVTVGTNSTYRGTLSAYNSSGFSVFDVSVNPSQIIAAQPVWFLRLSAQLDRASFWRQAPSGGASVEAFIVDSASNLVIAGTVGQKVSGTTWSNPSDPRLKDDVAPYAAGLAEISKLAPITYRLKAQPDGPLCYGFDASAVKDIFPECVSTTRMKLDAADEEETDDVLTFDMHPILVALVNAVKELAAKRNGAA